MHCSAAGEHEYMPNALFSDRSDDVIRQLHEVEVGRSGDGCSPPVDARWSRSSRTAPFPPGRAVTYDAFAITAGCAVDGAAEKPARDIAAKSLMSSPMKQMLAISNARRAANSRRAAALSLQPGNTSSMRSFAA